MRRRPEIQEEGLLTSVKRPAAERSATLASLDISSALFSIILSFLFISSSSRLRFSSRLAFSFFFFGVSSPGSSAAAAALAAAEAAASLAAAATVLSFRTDMNSAVMWTLGTLMVGRSVCALAM